MNALIAAFVVYAVFGLVMFMLVMANALIKP